MADVDVRVTTTGIPEAKQGVAELTAATTKLSDGTKALTLEQQRAQLAAFKATEALQQHRSAVEGASKEVQKILGHYDPLGAKLRQLQTDFSTLDKAITSGAIGGTPDLALDRAMRSLNVDIDKTKALMVTAGAAGAEGFGKAAGGAHEFSFASIQAQQSLMHLGREIMHGDFAMMPMTLARTAMHMHALPLLMNPVVLGIVGIGAAALAMGVAYAKGREETVAMNKAIALTGDYAGVTRGQMNSMADAISQAGTMTIGTSKEITTQLVASGRYSAENINNLAHLIESYANATGEATDKVTPKLIKMFEDPAKASEELNKQYHYLSTTELDRIRTLEETGRHQEAVTLAIKLLDEHLPKHLQNLGLLEGAWNGVKKALSSFWDYAKGIGRDKTPEEQIKALEIQMGQIVHDVGQQRAETNKTYQDLQRQVAALKAAKSEMEGYAQWSGVLAELNEKRARAHKEAEKSQYAQLQHIKNQIELVKEEPDPVLRNQRLTELEKQRANILRSLSADQRTLATDQITSATRLWDIQNKGAREVTDALLQLGLINKQAHDKERLAQDLDALARKQADEEEILKRHDLTKAQRQQHTAKIAQLNEEITLRQQAYEITVKTDLAKKYVANVLRDDRNTQEQLKAEMTMRQELTAYVAESGDLEVRKIQQTNLTHDEQVKKLEELKLHYETMASAAQADELLIGDAYAAMAGKIGKTIESIPSDYAVAMSAMNRATVTHTNLVVGLYQSAFANISKSMQGFLSGQVSLTGTISGLWSGVGAFLIEAFSKTTAEAILSPFKAEFVIAGEFLKGLFKTVLDAIVELAKPILTPIWDVLKSALSPVLEWIGSAFSGLFKGIVSGFTESIAGSATGSAAGSAVAGAAGGGGGLLSNIASGLGSFFGGGGASVMEAGVDVGWASLAGGSGSLFSSLIPGVGIALAGAAILSSLFGGGGSSPNTPILTFGYHPDTEHPEDLTKRKWFFSQVDVPGGEANVPLYTAALATLTNPSLYDQSKLFAERASGGSAGAMVAEIMRAQQIAHYQMGGEQLVTSPTLFMAGEVGPEKVTVAPLGGFAGNQGSSSKTINFHGPTIMDYYTMRRFVQDLQRYR